ncbi:hypothetical protein LPA44_11115 [Halobacterium sp. KA-4]|uniref:hypothetical protein n=1 Tax=Halobacterium sp. KA-4 TaxID=2896367 RepID=UPI001E4F0CB9|nr:hypothetical protein [Halobacterium sp. KA-4]MCD2200441.1 hypothetical protein [Halobacterium sp. KA-4]
MHRRTFLAGTTALLTVPLAGCAHPANVLDMREATPQALSDEMSRTLSPTSQGYETITDAVANGSATVAGTAPPIRLDEPIRLDDHYYEVSMTAGASRERTGYTIQVDYDPATSDANATIGYVDLPAVDQTALAGVIPPAGEPQDGDGFDIGTRHLYPDGTADASVLVPRQQYEFIRDGDSVYRVQVRAETVTETEYRYAVTQIATSSAAFAEQLRSTYQFALTGLSTAEQDVIEEAIDSGYFSEATDAFRSVIARFRAHQGLETSNSYGTWLVAYQGTPYIAYAEFPSEVTAAPSGDK